MIDDIVKSLQGDLEKGIEAFRRELGKVRTGRANLSILDGVRVDYYGTPTPLNQVASCNVADARLITSSATTAAMRPGTTNPGRPVVSATNTIAASGTR